MQKANRKDKAGISKDKLKIYGLFSDFAQDSVTKFTSLVRATTIFPDLRSW